MSVRALPLALLLAALVRPSVAAAAVPALLPIRGEVVDAGGSPLDGEHQLTFRLYDAASAGTPIYEETRTVRVRAGRFAVLVGALSPLPIDVFRSTSSAWIAIAVDGPDELAPRLALGSVPTAALAAVADDASTLGGRPLADYARASHRHAIGDFDGAPASYAPTPHGHPWSDITMRPTTYPPSAHRHTWSDVTGVPPDVADGDDDAGGDVDAVVAGSGLTGGGTRGDLTVGIAPGGITSPMIANGAIGAASLDPATIQLTTPSGSYCNPSSTTGGCAVSVADDGTLTCFHRTLGACTTVTCANPASGTSVLCACPAGHVIHAVTVRDIVGDGSDSDRVESITCCQEPT